LPFSADISFHGPLTARRSGLSFEIYGHLVHCGGFCGADGEDDGDGGGHLCSVLVAAAQRDASRRHQPRRLEIPAHTGRLDRVALAGDEQLLLQPVRLLLDELELPVSVPGPVRRGGGSQAAPGRSRSSGGSGGGGGGSHVAADDGRPAARRLRRGSRPSSRRPSGCSVRRLGRRGTDHVLPRRYSETGTPTLHGRRRRTRYIYVTADWPTHLTVSMLLLPVADDQTTLRTLVPGFTGCKHPSSLN